MDISQDQIIMPDNFQVADQPMEDIAPEDISVPIPEEPTPTPSVPQTKKAEEVYKVEVPYYEIKDKPLPKKKCSCSDCVKSLSCSCSCNCWSNLADVKKTGIVSFFFLLCHLGINYGFLYMFKKSKYAIYYDKNTYQREGMDNYESYEKYLDSIPGVGTAILVYLFGVGLAALGIFVECITNNTILSLLISIGVTFFDSLGILYCSNEVYDPLEACLWMLLITAFFLFISAFFYTDDTVKVTHYIITAVFGLGGLILSCNIHKHSYDFGWCVAFCIFGYISSILMHVWEEVNSNTCVFSPIYRLTFSGPCIVVAIAGACCGV